MRQPWYPFSAKTRTAAWRNARRVALVERGRHDQLPAVTRRVPHERRGMLEDVRALRLARTVRCRELAAVERGVIARGGSAQAGGHAEPAVRHRAGGDGARVEEGLEPGDDPGRAARADGDEARVHVVAAPVRDGERAVE